MFALLVRTELLAPWPDRSCSPDTYNQMFTLHGTVMIFLFLIPGIPAALGNFVLPIMLGAKDVAFPRLNLPASISGGAGAVFFLIVLATGGLDTGWTFYTPYSTTTGTAVVPAVAGRLHPRLQLDLHGPELHRHDPHPAAAGNDLVPHAAVPLGTVRHGADPGAGHAGAGHHAAAAGRRARARAWASSIPKLGGDPVLFQHFFWFYSHPAVYIMILPGMGIISELISVFSRKHIFGYRFIAYSSVAIALVGFLVWGHHMFVSGQSPLAGMIFSALTFAVAIPSAIKVFNWLATHVQRLDLAGHADVLRPGLHLPLRHRRADRAVPRRAGGQRRTCTTPTSSWPISITSWSAAR